MPPQMDKQAAAAAAAAKEHQARLHANLVGEHLATALFPDGKMVTQADRPGFPATLNELWIGANGTFGVTGEMHQALGEAYAVNEARYQGKPADQQVDGEVAGHLGFVFAKGQPWRVIKPFKGDFLVSDTHSVELYETAQHRLRAELKFGDYSGHDFLIVGTFHAHPPSIRYSTMSVDDIAITLIRPGEQESNPYMIHLMTNGIGVEAVVRTEATPILTTDQYVQERTRWLENAEALGQAYLAEAAAVQVPPPAPNEQLTLADHITRQIRAVQEAATAHGNQAVALGAEIALTVTEAIVNRNINALRQANNLNGTTAGEALNEAYQEALNFALSRVVIYQMCHEYNLLFLTNPDRRNERKLVVDSRSRKTA